MPKKDVGDYIENVLSAPLEIVMRVEILLIAIVYSIFHGGWLDVIDVILGKRLGGWLDAILNKRKEAV